VHFVDEAKIKLFLQAYSYVLTRSSIFWHVLQSSVP